MGAIYNQSSQDTPRYIHTSSFLEILSSTRDNGIGSEKEGLNRERNKEESRTWKTLKPNSSWSIIIFHPVSFLSLFYYLADIIFLLQDRSSSSSSSSLKLIASSTSSRGTHATRFPSRHLAILVLKGHIVPRSFLISLEKLQRKLKEPRALWIPTRRDHQISIYSSVYCCLFDFRACSWCNLDVIMCFLIPHIVWNFTEKKRYRDYNFDFFFDDQLRYACTGIYMAKLK